jgi:membrane-bound serine protease (ClpP class)
MKFFLRALLVLAATATATAARGADQSVPAGDTPPAPPPVEAQEPTLSPPANPPALPQRAAPDPVQIYTIRVHEDIGAPALYIVRNGIKEANEVGADFVVIHLDTYGGQLGATLDIMEAIEKSKARTITFVNDKAISAGAFISAATQDIYFSPRATMGAAAPVSGSGEEIDKTMKEKIVSFLSARIRQISEGHGYRGEVITAMMDDDFEFKIGETVIKPKGKLLTLTATEAMKTYGEPPTPLLAAGIMDDLPALHRHLAGGESFDVREFNITWSIKVFRWFNAISPILIGLGILGIYLEFQMGGHGWFAGLGIAMLLLVFVGNNTAGLSGHEPMLVFLLGVVLIVADLFLFPGTFILGGVGALLALGSLVWGMADLWPDEPITISGDLFLRPLVNLTIALAFAGALIVVLMRFLPRSWIFQRLAISQAVSGSAQTAGAAPEVGAGLDGLVGQTGIAVSGLFPSGQVEIAGRRYEARVAVGTVARGETVVVKARSDFGVIVEARKT